AERYLAFLELAPSLIAREARELRGNRLERALDAYAKVRELAAIAPRVSLDPAATVFQIGGVLARAARQGSLKRYGRAARASVMVAPFYIPTATSYPNGPPHIGHAYEAIAADTIARFQRATGRDVRFQTGTDEHGLKMAQAARGEGVEPRAFADKMSR